MHAHSKRIESGDVSLYSQSTTEVVQRALRKLLNGGWERTSVSTSDHA
jgi:hypothetical protein